MAYLLGFNNNIRCIEISFSEALKVRKVAEQALFDDFLEWYYNEFNDKEVKDDNNGK